MPRAKAAAMAAPGNGEVGVEKVDKIFFVRDVISKPSVYRHPREAAKTVVSKQPPAADVTIYGNNIGPPLKGRMASSKDLDDWLRRKKVQFNQPS